MRAVGTGGWPTSDILRAIEENKMTDFYESLRKVWMDEKTVLKYSDEVSDNIWKLLRVDR